MDFLSIITVNDRMLHGFYWFPHLPQVSPLVHIAVPIGNSIPSLRIFTMWRVAGVAADNKEASPNENEKLTAIHRRSLVPRGRLARGGIPQMLQYIYAPSPPDRGMLNRYLPSQYMPQRLRVCARPSNPWWGRGGGVSWTCTLRHGDSKTPWKMTKYITWGTFPTCAAPKIAQRSSRKGAETKNS